MGDASTVTETSGQIINLAQHGQIWYGLKRLVQTNKMVPKQFVYAQKLSRNVLNLLTCAPLGGRNPPPPPTTFSIIAQKRRRVAPPNFAYPSGHQFHTRPTQLNQSIPYTSIPNMTSEWRHVLPISTKNKGLRESLSLATGFKIE